MYNLYELYIRGLFVPRPSAWDNDMGLPDGGPTGIFTGKFGLFAAVDG
jgi:hypothetical protein